MNAIKNMGGTYLAPSEAAGSQELTYVDIETFPANF
jgi:hypothetical protein